MLIGPPVSMVIMVDRGMVLFSPVSMVIRVVNGMVLFSPVSMVIRVVSEWDGAVLTCIHGD